MDNPAVLDISYRSEGLAQALSNLMPYPFVIDEKPCASIEGFLQSLKFSVASTALELRGMSGMEAWRRGQDGNDWKSDQIIFWNREAIHRLSRKYQELITRAYNACFANNPGFRLALAMSGSLILEHKGKHNPSNTLLTRQEYLYQLYRLRAVMQHWPERFDIGLSTI